MDTVSDDFEVARDYLRPRPIGMTSFANRRRALQVQGAESAIDVAHEFVADIALGVYSSLEETNVPVSAHLLETWNQDLRSVLEIALQNANQEPAQMEPYKKALHVSGETFGAMLLTMPAVLDQLTQGRPAIVLLPTATSAVIGFIDEPESLVDAADAAEQLLAQHSSRAVSIVPLYRHDGAWTVVTWPEHAAEAYDRLHKRFSLVQYTAATEQLRAGELGQESVIASYNLFGGPGGQLTSVASVVEGDDTLIPPVDTVMLVQKDGTSSAVDLAELTEVDGLVVPVDGLIPSYLRVTRFPSELI